MKGDLFGWSPDIGMYVLRGGVTFTWYGDVFTQDINSVYRSGPTSETPTDPLHENYADWTPERREEAVREATSKREAYKKEREDIVIKRFALVASARAKLTEEEFQAVMEEGADDD